MNQHDISDKHLRRQRSADMAESRMEMDKVKQKSALEEKQEEKRHADWQRKKEQEADK